MMSGSDNPNGAVICFQIVFRVLWLQSAAYGTDAIVRCDLLSDCFSSFMVTV